MTFSWAFFLSMQRAGVSSVITARTAWSNARFRRSDPWLTLDGTINIQSSWRRAPWCFDIGKDLIIGVTFRDALSGNSKPSQRV
jgi:hypothetical protein